jgi:hypothetical protein
MNYSTEFYTSQVCAAMTPNLDPFPINLTRVRRGAKHIRAKAWGEQRRARARLQSTPGCSTTPGDVPDHRHGGGGHRREKHKTQGRGGNGRCDAAAHGSSYRWAGRHRPRTRTIQ